MSRVFGVLSVFVIIAINIIYYYTSAVVPTPEIYAENGSIENMQVVILFVAMILFLYGAYRSQRYIVFFYTAALLQFSFILRELDVEEMDLPSWIIAISGEEGRAIMLPVLWIIVIFIYFKNFSFNKSETMRLLISRVGLLTGISLLFLVLSDLAEKSILPLVPHQFWEELFELDGYTILIYVAFVLYFRAKNQSAGI